MLSDFLHRLRALLRPNAVEHELDDEIRLHLELEAGKYARAGKSQEEALRLAHLALGGAEQTKEVCRDVRGLRYWDILSRDVQFALRQIKRNPGFSVTAVTVLALGIGANTAIFSLLNEVMLRPVPARNPEQLIVPKWGARSAPHPYSVSEYQKCFAGQVKRPEESCSFSYPVFERLAARVDLFSAVAGFAGPMDFNVRAGGPASLVRGELVTGDFFRTLGVLPALGRMLEPRDDQTAAIATVVLSYGYWKGAFAADRLVVGKIIRINRVPFVISGVAAQTFDRLSPGLSCDLWLPVHASMLLGLEWQPTLLQDQHTWWLGIIGRLRQNVTRAHAQATLSTVFSEEMIGHTKLLKADSDPAIEVAPADLALIGVRERLARPLYILMCAVGLVLLIACSNVSGLMVARAAARSREMAIRLAIGAGRGRLVWQLMSESLVLAGLGALAGLAIAYLCTRSVMALIPWEIHVRPDSRALLFTTTVSIMSGLLFGLLPALRILRADPVSITHSRSPGLQHFMSRAGRQRLFANSLMIAQVALAVLMLAGAALLVRTLVNLRRTPTGFEAHNLLLFALDPVSARYTDSAIAPLYQAIRQRLEILPGVRGVTYSSRPLLSGGLSSTGVRIETRADLGEVPLKVLRVGADYFSTMSIPLLAGRDFTALEFVTDRPVALVNHAFADRYLHGKMPLGFHYGDDSIKGLKTEIVGVVGNTRYESLREPMAPTAFEPLRGGGTFFAVRTAADAAALIPAVRKLLRELDPNLPVFRLKTQQTQIDEGLFVERLITELAVAFGLLALILTSTGLYGLLSYEVTRRTREIGIRMAVGAAPHAVQVGVFRATLGIVTVGLAVGLPCALLATGALSGLLYGVEPNDPLTLGAVAALLLCVTSLAAYLPARRASRVDPLVALRCD